MKRGCGALIVIASIAIASCATNQSIQSSPSAASSPGIRTVEGRLLVGPGPHVEVPFKGGTLSASPDFNKPYSVRVKMDDSKTEFGANSFDRGCPKLETCTSIHTHWLGAYDEQIVSGDGRPWPDTEMWAVVRDVDAPVGPKVLGMTRSHKTIAFEGCTSGKIYSSANSPALMSVLEGETSAPTTHPPQSLEGDKNVYFVDNAKDDPRPVCNWRHRVGLDAVLPAPKTTAARFYSASEKTPAHVEVVAKSATIDLFVSKKQIDKISIHAASGHSMTIKPMYGTSDCLDGSHCEEVEVTTDNATVLQKSLDGQTLGRSRLWEISSPDGGPKIYQACTNGAVYSGRILSEVEAVLAGQAGKEAVQEDMVIDPKAGLPAPPGVATQATPLCDWAEREKKLREAVAEAQKAASERSKSDSQLKAPLPVSRSFN
jgi:hypothetical protein